MSHGTVDQVALDTIKRASADAGKRGLRVTGVASRYHGATRTLTFDYEPIRRARAVKAEPPAPTGRRTHRGVQGSLL